jgi:hypothetical protein
MDLGRSISAGGEDAPAIGTESDDINAGIVKPDLRELRTLLQNGREAQAVHGFASGIVALELQRLSEPRQSANWVAFVESARAIGDHQPHKPPLALVQGFSELGAVSLLALRLGTQFGVIEHARRRDGE